MGKPSIMEVVRHLTPQEALEVQDAQEAFYEAIRLNGVVDQEAHGRINAILEAAEARISVLDK